MSDLIDAMARRFYEAAHMRIYGEPGIVWEHLSQTRRDGLCSDMQDALTALRALRPDVAALLDGEAVAVPKEVQETPMEDAFHAARLAHDRDVLLRPRSMPLLVCRVWDAMIAASPYAQKETTR